MAISWHRWRSGLDHAADLFLGATCPGCAAPGLGVCADCRAALTSRRPAPTVPDPTPAGFPRCIATGPYDGRMRALLNAVKEQQVLLLTPVLADLLVPAVAMLLAGREHPCVDLVPVPSSPAAVRRRGYDATDALVRSAVRRLRADGHPVRRARPLRLVRRVADQSGLDAAARAANLTGAYGVRPDRLRPAPYRADPLCPVIVVDDLVTTGASLAEAARALRAAGRPVLGAAVVAATVRRNSRPVVHRR